jgi:hypothetical protein
MPAGELLLGDIAAWLASEYADQLRGTRQRTSGDGETALDVSLHPAAPDVTLTATDAGRITAIAETAAAGPGYHRFVGRVLERMGAASGIAWRVDAADGFAFAERSVVESAYLGWLGPTLGEARTARRRGATAIHLGLPEGTRFSTDGAILTALGPRDDAWIDAAITDPRTAIDITPWWSDATDSRHLLNRALVLLWTQVRWRAPAVEGEAELLADVHHLLTRAYTMEPDLPYPWHAWADVIALRGLDDGMARQAVDRAYGSHVPAVPIGYRRDPVRIGHEGWTLEIPGDFAERRTPDEWWGGGAGRRITLAAVPTGPMSAQAFVSQFAADLGDEALTHRDGDLVGRARLTSDPSSGLEVGVLDGFSAVTGSGAAIRIEFEDPADWHWALDMWRSLAPG